VQPAPNGGGRWERCRKLKPRCCPHRHTHRTCCRTCCLSIALKACKVLVLRRTPGTVCKPAREVCLALAPCPTDVEEACVRLLLTSCCCCCSCCCKELLALGAGRPAKLSVSSWTWLGTSAYLDGPSQPESWHCGQELRYLLQKGLPWNVSSNPCNFRRVTKGDTDRRYQRAPLIASRHAACALRAQTKRRHPRSSGKGRWAFVRSTACKHAYILKIGGKISRCISTCRGANLRTPLLCI